MVQPIKLYHKVQYYIVTFHGPVNYERVATEDREDFIFLALLTQPLDPLLRSTKKT